MVSDRMEVECPICERTFDSKHGLGSHFGHKHTDEKLTKKCEYCGEEFEVSPSNLDSRKYCSRKCATDDQKIRVVRTCEYCGKKYESKPSKNKRFCSRTCRNKGLVKSGEEHYAWKDKVEKTCPICGKVFKVVPSKENTRVFCSPGCYYDWSSGENNYNWKGGESFEPYDENWTEELKEKVRQRDEYQCQFCKLTNEEHKAIFNKILHVHHVDGDKKNSAIGNLITLCAFCHMRWHRTFGFGEQGGVGAYGK